MTKYLHTTTILISWPCLKRAWLQQVSQNGMYFTGSIQGINAREFIVMFINNRRGVRRFQNHYGEVNHYLNKIKLNVLLKYHCKVVSD